MPLFKSVTYHPITWSIYELGCTVKVTLQLLNQNRLFSGILARSFPKSRTFVDLRSVDNCLFSRRIQQFADFILWRGRGEFVFSFFLTPLAVLSIINSSSTPLLYKDVAHVLFQECLEKFPDKPTSVHIVFTSVDSLLPTTTWLEKRGVVPPIGRLSINLHRSTMKNTTHYKSSEFIMI